MPSYELLCIARKMSKRNLISCLKRVGEEILDNDGVLRKIEYLGMKQLPYKMSSRHIPGKPHRVANFVLYHFDSPPEKSLYLKDRYKLDSDILRAKIISKDKHIEPDYKCTLEEESLPPSYRKTVQELLNKKPKEYGLPTKPPKQEYEF